MLANDISEVVDIFTHVRCEPIHINWYVQYLIVTTSTDIFWCVCNPESLPADRKLCIVEDWQYGKYVGKLHLKSCSANNRLGENLLLTKNHKLWPKYYTPSKFCTARKVCRWLSQYTENYGQQVMWSVCTRLESWVHVVWSIVWI
jgi:hypothetical protein